MSDIDFNAITADLKELASQTPPRKKTTKKDQIRRLEGQIRSLLSQGWNASDIVVVLKKHGLDLTASALKNQLYHLNKERGQVRSAGRQGNGQDPVSTPVGSQQGDTPRRPAQEDELLLLKTGNPQKGYFNPESE